VDNLTEQQQHSMPTFSLKLFGCAGKEKVDWDTKWLQDQLWLLHNLQIRAGKIVCTIMSELRKSCQAKSIVINNDGPAICIANSWGKPKICAAVDQMTCCINTNHDTQ